jgi:hypothetical protein
MPSKGVGKAVSWLVLFAAIAAFILVFFGENAVDELFDNVMRLLRILVRRLLNAFG